MRRQFAKAGWRIHLSPCDESGKKASAGVGVIWREDEVHIFHKKIHDSDLQHANARGIVAKYVLDVGWERAFTIYNLYGCSGGSSSNIATTEALVQACRQEMEGDVHNPKLLMGDFNARPNSLGPVCDLIREDQWADLGHRADWWSGTLDRWTCHAKAEAKRSRIDGIVADSEALASVQSFSVEKREHIPTHCVLKLQLTRSA